MNRFPLFTFQRAFNIGRLKGRAGVVRAILGGCLVAWVCSAGAAAQPARVFVAAQGSNSILAIDPVDNSVVATIPVAGTPGFLASPPDGSRLFVPGRTSNLVTVINTTTNATTPLMHASLLEPVAVAFVPNRSEVWVLNRQGGPGHNGSITVFNSATLAFIEEITSTSFSQPEHIAVDPSSTRALVVNGGNATLSVILTASRSVLFSAAVGVGPRFVVTASNFAYVSNSGSGNVSRVSLGTRVVTSIPIGGQPLGMALDTPSNRLLVALQSDRMGIINVQTLESSQVLVGDAAFSSHSVALLAGSSLLYVTDSNGNRVSALNLANLTPVSGNGLPIGALNAPRSITTTGTVSTADLTATLGDSPDPVSGGQPLTYTVHIANGGPSSATEISLTLELSGPFQLLSATVGQGSCEAIGGIVLCELGTLDFQQGLDVVIQISPLAAGSFGASATVSADQADPNPADNTAMVTTIVTPAADLAVTIVDSPDPVAVGGLLTYLITVTNNGPLLSEGVRLFDPLPEGLQLSSVTGGLANCISGSRSVICNLESLLPGSSTQISIRVIPTAPGNLLNGADVRARTNDPNESNNAVIVSTTVVAGGADLELTKTALSPLAYSGSTTLFRFRVANLGPNPAAGIEVEDSLPQGLEFVSVAPLEGVQCGAEQGPLRCRIVSLASGSSIDLILSLHVSALPGAALSNTAAVSAVGPDPQPANNQSTASIQVTQKGDVNGDGVLDASDVQSLIIELNDGDGDDVIQAPSGGFAGNASMDLNGDGRITAADLSELVDLIFG